MKVFVRRPGVPGWHVSLTWPEGWRVPVVGELIDIAERGQFIVQHVAWHHATHEVQLIVEGGA